MINDGKRIFDGFESLAGGVDAGRVSSLIEENQCVSAENYVFRGGSPTTRPGFSNHTLQFGDTLYYTAEGLETATTPAGEDSETVFKNGFFQGAFVYSPLGQEEKIAVMISGRLFIISPGRSVSVVNEIQIPEKRNRKTIPIAYFAQADRFLVIQDGESKPIIFDGVTARRAADNEVPIGTIMAYGMGRLVVLRPWSRLVIFGDLYGSHEGDPGEAVLKFTETNFLSEGFPASIPYAMGRITAAMFYPQQDTSTGNGELLVFTELGMTSFFLSLPRDQWKESTFQRVGLLNIGAMGHRSLISVNGDLWFRARDGWRSYRQARAEINGWSHLPLSPNIRPWIEADTENLLDYSSAINFDNRLICTSSPRSGGANSGALRRRMYHRRLASLDFDVLSSFGQAQKPAWDGTWVNFDLKVLQLVQGRFSKRQRAFVLGINEDGENALFEIDRMKRQDFSGPIDHELITRSMNFKQPFNEKALCGADLWLRRIGEQVECEIAYRPDDYADFSVWKTLEGLGPIGVCGDVTCGGCPTIREGFAPRKKIGEPPEACDDATKRRLVRGFEYELRLRTTGFHQIRRLRVHARQLTEDPKGDC